MLAEKDQTILDLELQLQQRKKTDEEARNIRTISDQSNYGNAIASLDGVLVYVNESFAKMHGWQPDELLRKPGTT